MRSARSEQCSGFQEELHQLVHTHLEDGDDPADILDALQIQTEIVRTRLHSQSSQTQHPSSSTGGEDEDDDDTDVHWSTATQR